MKDGCLHLERLLPGYNKRPVPGYNEFTVPGYSPPRYNERPFPEYNALPGYNNAEKLRSSMCPKKTFEKVRNVYFVKLSISAPWGWPSRGGAVLY